MWLVRQRLKGQAHVSLCTDDFFIHPVPTLPCNLRFGHEHDRHTLHEGFFHGGRQLKLKFCGKQDGVTCPLESKPGDFRCRGLGPRDPSRAEHQTRKRQQPDELSPGVFQAMRNRSRLGHPKDCPGQRRCCEQQEVLNGRVKAVMWLGCCAQETFVSASPLHP